MRQKRRSLKHKFGAKPTVYNETRYDSKLEARYAQRLDALKESGQLLFYLPQVGFPLPGNSKYRVDFQEFWPEHVVFTDCKGYDTPLSKLKISQVEELYGIKINIVRKV